MNKIMIINSNKIKKNKTLDIKNSKNNNKQIRQLKIKEKEMDLDSKLPIHEIKGNNNDIKIKNTILELSIAIPSAARAQLSFKFKDHGINDM